MRAAQPQIGAADRPHAHLVVRAREEGAEGGCERRLAERLQPGLGSDDRLLRDVHLHEPLGRDRLELLGVGGVADLAVEHHEIGSVPREPCQRLPERLARRAPAPCTRAPASACSSPSVSGLMSGGESGRTVSDRMPPSSSIACAACSSLIALPCQPSWSATKETPWPFSVRATIMVGPSAADASVYAASIAATSCPSISIVRHPYACARRANRSPFQPCIVGPRWPSRFMSRIATRSSTWWKRGRLDGLPDRPLGHLGVAHQHEDAPAGAVESHRERHAEPDREPLAERAGGDVDPRQLGHRRRVTLDRGTEAAQREQLVVGDRADRLERGVERRRRVSLRHDESIVRRRPRILDVEPQVARVQHGQQMRARQRRCRVTGARLGRAADAVHADLRGHVVPELDAVVHRLPLVGDVAKAYPACDSVQRDGYEGRRARGTIGGPTAERGDRPMLLAPRGRQRLGQEHAVARHRVRARRRARRPHLHRRLPPVRSSGTRSARHHAPRARGQPHGSHGRGPACARSRRRSVTKPTYDHLSGSFGPEETVEPARDRHRRRPACRSPIVRTRGAIDVAVFLEPEEVLRRRWKLERDVFDRGYSAQRGGRRAATGGKPTPRRTCGPSATFADIVVAFQRRRRSRPTTDRCSPCGSRSARRCPIPGLRELIGSLGVRRRRGADPLVDRDRRTGTA